jgi:WD40 repeat protein
VLKTSEDNAYFSNMKLAVKKIGTLTGHSGAVYSLSEGPREKGANSPHFFTGSSDKFLALWNLETLQAEKFAAQFPLFMQFVMFLKKNYCWLEHLQEAFTF